jgi:hypothetical protein
MQVFQRRERRITTEGERIARRHGRTGAKISETRTVL